jgi:hypothetical protein
MYLRGLAGGIEWIQVAQVRELWWALVNTMMNLPGSVATERVS